MIDDNNSNIALNANNLMMNMGSIDSRDASEFNSNVNTVNNKNNRKLKKMHQDVPQNSNLPINFIEDQNFMQSQSVLNESAINESNPNIINEERRAKSSLGENSATRLRSKLMGA